MCNVCHKKVKIQIFQKPFDLNLKLVLCNDALYLSVCQIICLFNANNEFCPKISGSHLLTHGTSII